MAPDRLAKFAVVGELALDGTVWPVKGAPSTTMSCPGRGLARLLVPAERPARLPWSRRWPATGSARWARPSASSVTVAGITGAFGKFNRDDIDFADVRGQESARRALVVTASGEHDVSAL